MKPRVSNIAVKEAFNDARIKIGRRIRDRRIHEGLSQQKLADMVGMSKSVLGDIERGHGNALTKTLVKLAVGLNVDVSYFFSDGIFSNYDYSTINLNLDIKE